MSRRADRRKSLERELDAEIRAHLDMAIEDRLASGVPLEEAERLALEEFGDVERVTGAALAASRSWLDPLQLFVEALMSKRTRLVTIAAAGALALVGVLALPLDALMVPRWNDHLSFTPHTPDIRGTIRICVSDFEVLSDGVLSFTVEDGRRDYGWFEKGKRYVIAADGFTLQQNNERCGAAR
jgi:hypothetical protein